MNHQPQLHLCERNICERSQEPPQPPWWEMKEVSSPGRLVLRLMLIYLKFHEFSWAWIIIACFFFEISWHFVSMNHNCVPVIFSKCCLCVFNLTLPETNSFAPQKMGHLQRKGSSSNHQFSGATPWKINMEPTNHPFRKEHDLPNLNDYVPC